MGYCEYGNELSGSIREEEFDQISDYQLPKNDCAREAVSPLALLLTRSDNLFESACFTRSLNRHKYPVRQCPASGEFRSGPGVAS